MKYNRYSGFSFSLFFFGFLLVMASVASGGNDPSIDGDLRKTIQANMQTFIDRNTVEGAYSIYDPVDGKLRKLTLLELHEGIVKKGDYYVSCADFLDSNKNKVDLDFMVIPDGNRLQVTQAVIHSADGKKRKYHLEN